MNHNHDYTQDKTVAATVRRRSQDHSGGGIEGSGNGGFARRRRSGASNVAPTSEDSNFIEVYLSKIAETTDIKSSFYGDTGMHNLQRSLTGVYT